ncbi:MAG: hypothetical protein ACREAX_05510 [Candidatus Nitrosotenuis sp.]
MVNRHAIIAIASIVIIAGTVGYSSLNLVFAKDLQFRWYQEGNFDLLSIMFGGKLVVCNDSIYPANFQQYSFNMIYDGQNLGTFSTRGIAVSPHTSTTIDGKFITEDKQVSQILLSSLDTAFSGSGQAARIDVRKMSAITILDTKIIGVIPLSITREYSGQEFLDMMNQKTSCDK